MQSELAASLYMAGYWDDADSLYADLYAESPDSYEFLGRLGLIVANRGERDSALAVSERLAEIDRPYTRGGPTA